MIGLKIRRQRGVALLTVLLVVAIVTVISATMIARQQLLIRTTGNQQLSRQAWHYALGGEALAQIILEQDFKVAGANPREPIDHLGEAWARPLPVFEIEHGEIAVRIEDPSARFNLNSLMQGEQPNEQAVEQFRRLLQRLEISPIYADRLLDWLDSDQQTRGEYGAEDSAYLGLLPAYRAANQPLQDVSELRLLFAMTEAEYRKLAPYISALPSTAKLNVNTASPLVLSTLGDGLSVDAAMSLVDGRGQNGYQQLADFLAQPALSGMTAQGGGLAVGSQYFQVRSEVRVAERRQVLLSTLQRDNKGKVWVLQRNLGQAAQRLVVAKQNNKEEQR